MKEKALLRKEILALRDSIGSSVKPEKDQEIKKRLFSDEIFVQAKAVMLFASFRTEPDTFEMIRHSLTLEKTVVLPKVDRERHELLLYSIKNLDELKSGYMNISEPVVGEERRFQAKLLDLIVVPGVAFDELGGRLGYGGGYYDRLIGNLEKLPSLIAIAYEEQVIASVPMSDHDARVDCIITDQRSIKVKDNS